MNTPHTLMQSIFAGKDAVFVLFVLWVCSSLTNVWAEGFDTFGDQQRLENQAIIAAGNIGKRTSLTAYSSDTSYFDRQKQTIYEIGRYCFKSSDSYEDISGKAGLLLVDQFSNTSIGVVTDSISSIKVKLTGVQVLDCVSLSMQESKRLQNQLNQQLEALKQQRALLDQMLKNQRPAPKKTP